MSMRVLDGMSEVLNEECPLDEQELRNLKKAILFYVPPSKWRDDVISGICVKLAVKTGSMEELYLKS